MRGFVYVDEQGVKDDLALRDWVALSVQFAGSLPPK